MESVASSSDKTETEVNIDDLINDTLKVENSEVSTTSDITEALITVSSKTTPTTTATVAAATTVSSSTSSTIITAAATNNDATPAVTTAATTNNSKIQKPLTSSTIARAIKTTPSGQVVILQGPLGQSVPLRIATSGTINNQNNNNSSGNTSQNKPVTIQVLKMPDGSFVPIKNNKALNLTNLSNVTHMNIGTKKPTSGSNQTILIKNTTNNTINASSTTTAVAALVAETTPSSTTTGAQIIKSVISNDNQESDSLKSKIAIENVKQSTLQQKYTTTTTDSPSTTITTTTTSASTSITLTTASGSVAVKPTVTSTTGNTKILQKISSTGENKDILIKTENDSGSKQILVPHHVLKISPSSSNSTSGNSSSGSGSIQAIQIPGKVGIQYVKVIGTSSSVSSNNCSTTTTARILNTSLANSTTKLTQISGTGQKIILNTKARPSTSTITLNKDASNKQKSLITIPMLKKITDTDKPSLIKKEIHNQLQSNNSLLSKINNNNKSTTNGHQSNNNINNNKTPQLFMISKELLKKVQIRSDGSSDNNTNNNNDIGKKSIETITSPKKLYSVLKPNIQDSITNSFILEDTSSLNRRHSLSPSDGPRRKHCNCTKSQCLKLYCDCFANGEFCQDCNCKECLNNLENEGERQKAIKICLERNPNAFKPKITKARDQSDLRLHNKGCNCKRSGCLKNYCECYEAKITCSSNCKCLGCRNVEDHPDHDQTEETKLLQQQQQHQKQQQQRHYGHGRGNAIKRRYSEIETSIMMQSSIMNDEPINKQTYNFITEDVVDATVQCMFAQTEECKKSDVNEKNSERMVVEELGRCLVEIIDFSIRNMDN